MGMDLIAENPTSPETGHFHANWTGWGMLADLLVELECDVTKLAGSNDGDLVDATTAVAWADAIDTNLDRIFLEYPEKDGLTGFARLRVAGTNTPVHISSSDTAAQIAQRLMGKDPYVTGTHSKEEMKTTPLKASEDDLNWVSTFSHFCRHSGGFRQF